MRANGLVLDAVGGLVDKGFEQHGLGIAFGQAARLGVEQLVFVELRHGCAMSADDVICKNFQLGLVVHCGTVRQQDRLALHGAIGLLCARRDDHLALIDANGVAIEDRLEIFAALPVRGDMLDDQRRVDMIATFQQIGPRQLAFRLFTIKAQEDLTAQQTATARQRVGVEGRASLKADEQMRDMRGSGRQLGWHEHVLACR